jgi:hypothetical protein
LVTRPNYLVAAYAAIAIPGATFAFAIVSFLRVNPA